MIAPNLLAVAALPIDPPAAPNAAPIAPPFKISLAFLPFNKGSVAPATPPAKAPNCTGPKGIPDKVNPKATA